MKTMLELFREVNEITYKTAGNDVNYAFDEIGNELYIFFQGSSSVADWIENFMFKKRPYKDMEYPYKVHRGFLKAWKQVEDIIIAKVTEKNGDAYRWQRVVIVGYSHGGALSGLCHECVWFHRPDLRYGNIIGYGFESPRFFGGWFVGTDIEERWEGYKVIRTNNDIVTHCPPWILGYRHVGEVEKHKGDAKLVNNKLPRCVKSHYPQVVEDGIKNEEKK